MRSVMTKLNIEGTVILLGTPGELFSWTRPIVAELLSAEEGGEGKLKLLKAGACKSRYWSPRRY